MSLRILSLMLADIGFGMLVYAGGATVSEVPEAYHSAVIYQRMAFTLHADPADGCRLPHLLLL
jgi:hypothetical protein